jgi:hypothetical protein
MGRQDPYLVIYASGLRGFTLPILTQQILHIQGLCGALLLEAEKS